MGVELTLMNQSYDPVYNVVILPKNTRVAWKVFSSPAYSHTFLYPANFPDEMVIGVLKGVAEGDTLSDADLMQLTTAVSLSGIKKADLIMTGGGFREPYRFTLLPR